MRDHFEPHLQKAKLNDRLKAQVLTRIESEDLKILADSSLFNPNKFAFRMGITGPPGAGKSTFIGKLIGLLNERKMKIGVLAVDPSSPFSKGAILGDRLRFHLEDQNEKNIFIRSLATRGFHGGLTATIHLLARAFDVWEFDILIIETVGVGQAELEIDLVADRVGVLLVPESGDEIQLMKAGIMEVGDFFIINKSDRPGADTLYHEIKRIAPACQTNSLTGEGLDIFVDWLLKERTQYDFKNQRNDAVRLRAEAKSLLYLKFLRESESRINQINIINDLKNLLKQI